MVSKQKWHFLDQNDVQFSGDRDIWSQLLLDLENKNPFENPNFHLQLIQNAFLTRDNMKKRNWPGSPMCSFCTVDETANHLFLECAVAHVIWGALGTRFCPNNVWQSVVWFCTFLPGRDKLYLVVIAAICWAIWKSPEQCYV